MAANPAPEAAALAPGQIDQLLRQLEWTVLRRLHGQLQGDYRTWQRGNGIDLADLREYQPHDDVRHIDWNVTARLHTPYVRVFHEDREMSTWFVLDLSGSASFGSGRMRKSTLAQAFVGLLARLLVRHGNRVGAMLFGQGDNPPAVLPPRNGRQQVLQVMQAMASGSAPLVTQGGAAPPARPNTSGASYAARGTALGPWLKAAGALARQRSTVIVVSDFICDTQWPQALGQLARRHDVVAVRLFDPLEQHMPTVGLLNFRDAETGETLLIDTHDAGWRTRFAQLAATREFTLRQAFTSAGVDALELSTEEDLADALLRFDLLRRQRAGQTGGPAQRNARSAPAHQVGTA